MTKTFLIAVAASAFLLTAAPPAPEVSAQEDAPVFQSKVTLIEVPVVIRDKNGKAVGTLRKEDFQLFDKGKPQVILKFSVEHSGSGKQITSTGPKAAPNPGAKEAELPVVAPDHFIGFLFDDTHMAFDELVYARKGVQKFIASKLRPADRVAIFTTSAQAQQDFTDDRNLLNKALLKISPHPYQPPEGCPPESFEEAIQIRDWFDRKVQEAVARRAIGLGCAKDMPEAIALTGFRAVTVMNYYDETLHYTRTRLIELEKQLARMPGQRSLVMASPGFSTPPIETNMEPAIEQAIQAGVVINTLDPRGVPDPMVYSYPLIARQREVLDELASGTGGRFIRNTNDIDGGIETLASQPEVSYLLGFSPQDLKPDGSLHQLKVTLRSSPGMSVQARLGYYAPNHLATAEEEAKAAVDEAVFSLDEMNDIPAVMSTRFVKASEKEVKLTVTSQVDVRRLPFRKSDGRDVDSIRVVCALFDGNGNFVQADAKTIQLNLLDAGLQSNQLSGGIPVRSDFTVPPGDYVIRLVLRDAEGQTMTAQNTAVKIP